MPQGPWYGQEDRVVQAVQMEKGMQSLWGLGKLKKAPISSVSKPRRSSPKVCKLSVHIRKKN